MIDFTAEQYVDDVLSGEIVTCRWVKLACERHRADLETGHERGLWFDEDEAKRVIAFFHLLPHVKGDWDTEFIYLEPVQQFWLWSLFGWKNDDGSRRFRTAYLEVARKNTKTTLSAGLGLYLAFFDGELGAEVYSVATKKDQAKICHDMATSMVKKSPLLKRAIQIYRNNLSQESTGSKFEPLASDSDSLDGLNVHAAICDELHAWKGDELWGVVGTATGARRQPLIIAITTSGTNQQGICYRQRDYVGRVLKEVIQDDRYWGMIYTLDTQADWPDLEQDDDWREPEHWVKSNPMIGVSAKVDKLEQEYTQAVNDPTALNRFLRWHLDVWTRATTRWVSPLHWSACGKITYSEESLLGRPSYGGLDLAQIYDLAAYVKVFPPEADDELYKIICRFWLPEENMHERVKRDQVPYDVWVRQGFITLTPGNVIDYDFIEDEILQLVKVYQTNECAYDPYGASQIVQHLQDAMGDDWMVPHRQGFISMSPPMKELGRLIASHQIAHNNNPVLTWMIDNLVARTDPAGNIKPDKEKSREKIDGVVALIMALDRATRETAPAYNNGGLLIL